MLLLVPAASASTPPRAQGGDAGSVTTLDDTIAQRDATIAARGTECDAAIVARDATIAERRRLGEALPG